MHLLFILDYFHPYIGGIETLFDDVADFGIQQGHTIYILTSRYDKRLPIIEKQKGVTIYRVGTNRFTIILYALRFGITHPSFLQSIDHIHTSTFCASMPSWILSKIYRKPCTITIHEIYDTLRYHLKGRKGRFYIVFEKIVIGLPWNHIIAVSHYTRSMIQKIYKVPDGDISVIYNQINHIFWDKNTIDHNDIIQLQKKHNLTDKEVGLYIGRLGYEKGLPYLIESLCDIITDHPNFRLVIIAPTNPHLYNKHTQEQILSTKNHLIDNHLHHHIIRIDPVSDDNHLKTWMAMSDIGIVPSMSEGYCYTAVQMESMGLPLIVSKVGALPEVLNNHHSFVGYGKIKEISDAINKNLNISIQQYQGTKTKPSINYQEYYDLFEKYKG